MLADLLSLLHDRSLRFWAIPLSGPMRMQRVQDEHLRILEGIRERDPVKATTAMRTHINSFRLAITERVR